MARAHPDLMKIQLDPIERIMVELVVWRERYGQLVQQMAAEKKQDVFRILTIKYGLDGVISVSDDFRSLEVTPEPAQPDPSNTTMPATTPASATLPATAPTVQAPDPAIPPPPAEPTPISTARRPGRRRPA